MSENQKKRQTLSELCATCRSRKIAAGFSAHRAGGRGRKSRARQGTAQIVFGIAVVARKIRTAQAQNFHDLSWGCVLGEQFSGQPQIDDTPIRARKALANAPTFNPTLVHGSCAFAGDWSAWYARTLLFCRLWRRSRSDSYWPADLFGAESLEPFLSGIEQLLCGGGQDGLGTDQLHPVREHLDAASRRLTVGEADQAAQVPPVGAGPVAAIALSQEPAKGRGQCRFQRRGADAHPSLEMTGTGLDHDTWFVAMCAHIFEQMRADLIEVEENIARVAAFGIGPQVDVEAQLITFAQRTHDGGARQVLRGPQPLSQSWSSCEGVNQADQIELIGHSRQLSADGLAGKEQSQIKHAAEHELGAHYPTINFQRIVTSVLTCWSG
jgi:hypothetical protein